MAQGKFIVNAGFVQTPAGQRITKGELLAVFMAYYEQKTGLFSTAQNKWQLRSYYQPSVSVSVLAYRTDAELAAFIQAYNYYLATMPMAFWQRSTPTLLADLQVSPSAQRSAAYTALLIRVQKLSK